MDVVEDLLNNPFNRRSMEDKKSIVEMGRPCPELPNLKMMYKEKKGAYIRKFQRSQYDIHPWLCGSSKLNKLFCWPCLLFSNIRTTWSKDGFVNLNNLANSQQKHKVSVTHLQCILSLNNFGVQRIDEMLDYQLKISNSEHNKKVAKNREILKRLIDATCFLANQELAFRGHDESKTSKNKGNYLELLDLLKNYDSLLRDHLDTATIFRGTSSAIQNDIITATSQVIEDEILEEVKKAPFAAIMLDETSDIQMISQLSTVIRYVSSERFIGFIDVSSDRTSNGLLSHVESIVGKLELETKLIAQTYDGAAVMSGHLNGLQQKVREKFKNALHVHCYAHVLNLVLSQSFSDIKSCNIFFQTLNSIATFSSHSTRRTYALKEFLKRKIPSLTTVRWSFTSRLINVIHEYSSQIKEYFEHILNGQEWDIKDKMAAKGYIKFLSKFESIFLLKVFSKLYAYTDVIFSILQQKDVDIGFCAGKIREFQVVLQEMRENGFSILWSETEAIVACNPIKRAKKRNSSTVSEESEENMYKRLYFEIIDHTARHISDRFSSIEKLKFLNLIKPSTREIFEAQLASLMDTYGDYFDLVSLRNELTVFNTNNNLPVNAKSAAGILEYLTSSNLMSSGFEEMKKLCSLICTIPATTASVERSFSALKRIKTYTRSTQAQN